MASSPWAYEQTNNPAVRVLASSFIKSGITALIGPKFNL